MHRSWRIALLLALAMGLSLGALTSCQTEDSDSTGWTSGPAERTSPPLTSTPVPRLSTSTPLPTSTPPSPLPTDTPLPPPTNTPEPPLTFPPDGPIFLEVTPHGQERLLTCEAATVRMLLGYVGLKVPEEEIQAAFPVSEDPTEGYRGTTLDGDIGGFVNYGAHAPAVANVVQHFLDRAGVPYLAVWKTFSSQQDALVVTYRALRDGSPVILWMTWQARKGNVPQTKQVSFTRTFQVGWHYPQDYNDLPPVPITITVPYTVTLVAGEHVEVAYGVEGRQVYVVDPWSYHEREGRLVRDRPDGFYFNWESGPVGWKYFDYAMVYIVPRP